MRAQSLGIRFCSLLIAAFFFTAAFPAIADRGHSPFDAPQPPAADAPKVSAEGIVHDLRVDNLVTGVRTRYLWLRIDNGSTVALRGPGLDALIPGQRVEVVGRSVGETLLVSSARTVATAPTKAASARAPVALAAHGMLAVAHADYFDQGRGDYRVVVLSADGHATVLKLPIVPEVLRIDMSVIAEGTLDADGFSLEASAITIVALPDPSEKEVAAALGTRKVLVMLIKFTDSPTDPFTPAAVQQAMVTDPGSVANYYNEVSYGRQLLDITVTTTWLQAGVPTPANCDWVSVGNLADAKAQSAGYNVANYDNRYYVMPQNPACGFAGVAYIGAPYKAWSNGVNALWVHGHELGHNFSLWHSGSLTCAGQVIGGSCSVREYGDPFDVMGDIEAMHFNAMQKRLLNWISAVSVKTHTAGTATYTLSPLELDDGEPGTYAVRIPAAPNRVYWLEYRQPIGFDSRMSLYPNNGAQIRVANPFEFPCTNCGGNDTQILDMTLSTPGIFGDAALLVGQTYFDSTFGISVGVISATPSALTLSVSGPGASPPTTTTVSSSANPSMVGAQVTFTASVTGNAPAGSVAFTDGGIAIPGCSAVALTGEVNHRMATCSTSFSSAGMHSIVAAYGGDSANTPSNSAPLPQMVNGGQINVALASLGAVATSSSTYSAAFPVASVNNNERAGVNWNLGGGWADATPNVFPDSVQIAFSGWQTIDHVIVYTLQDNYVSPVEPTDFMTFSTWGITAFTVQGWNGSAWVTLGSVSGNNLVKRTVSFSAFTTDRIRVNVNNALGAYSRIVEIEALGVAAATLQTNVAAGAAGAVASASSTYSGNYPVAPVNNGDRAGIGWGAGGGWADATPDAFPDWVQIAFNGLKTIDNVIVYTVQDNYVNPVEPSDDTMTFNSWGVTDFTVQGWNGAAWLTLGSVSGNNRVRRTVSTGTFTTDKIRVNVTGALASYSRLVEIEVFGVPAGPVQTNVASVDSGAVASASSTLSANFPVATVNNGDRAGVAWGAGGGWADATPGSFPDWAQITFNGQKTIDHVIVYTVQDNYSTPIEPTDTMTFSNWGITDFTVEGWDGATWVTLGTVTGNNLVKRTVNFNAFATDRIRVNVTNALGGYSRIVEIEAWGN